MKNVLFVVSGNCRTFIDCIDSIYMELISKLFPQDANIYLYLYLKTTDPGPKGQTDWNFEYEDVDCNLLVEKIGTLGASYPTLNIDYKILYGDEISNDELVSQVKSRHLYIDHYAKTSTLLRGLHCHYNLERCGYYILEKEDSIQAKFDYIVYVRPDLFFTEPCSPIDMYNSSLVTLGTGPCCYNNDHVAIIPRDYLDAFFLDRMSVYRNNTVRTFSTPEEVYWHTIKYEVKDVGKYHIKRP